MAHGDDPREFVRYLHETIYPAAHQAIKTPSKDDIDRMMEYQIADPQPLPEMWSLGARVMNDQPPTPVAIMDGSVILRGHIGRVLHPVTGDVLMMVFCCFRSDDGRLFGAREIAQVADITHLNDYFAVFYDKACGNFSLSD
jgi:hypothetical protein